MPARSLDTFRPQGDASVSLLAALVARIAFVPEPGALGPALAALALLRFRRATLLGVAVASALAGGAADAAVYWVPGYDGGTDFQIASFGAIDEVGWLCPGELCSWTDSDSKTDSLEVGPPFFGSRFGQTLLQLSTPSTNAVVATRSYYDAKWQKDGPSYLHGQVVVIAYNALGLSPTPLELPEAELWALGEARSSARLCFEVSDLAVTLRLWGVASPPTSDQVPGETAPDLCVVEARLGETIQWSFVAPPVGSVAFDSGPLLVEPGTVECFLAAIYTDEVATSNAQVGWNDPLEDNAGIFLDFEILPVPEPGALVQGLAALLVLFAALLGGAVRAAIHFVPNEDGEDDFRTSVRVIAGERGPICDPGGPTLAAITADVCSVYDEGEEGDLLEEVLASGSFGALTEAVAILTAVSARSNARYEITWDTLGPSLAMGHVELEVRGETEADDAPLGSAREAYAYADARVQLCFRVADEPVSVRLVGSWQGALSDVQSELAVPDFGLITIDPSGPRVTSPAVFDTGSYVVPPGPLRQCIRALLTADETLLADPSAIVPEWTDASSLSFDFTIQPAPVPEPGALLQGLAPLAALLLAGLAKPARAFVAIDPVSAACHRSDPEASPFDLSLRARLYEADACPGPGQCEDEIDERSQDEVPAAGGFAAALGRDMEVAGPASGEVRVATSAAWSYAEQVFGEQTGQSLAAGTLEMSLLVEFVVPDGMRAASAVASARGCYCFEVTEFPVLFDAFVVASDVRDPGYEQSPNAPIFVELPEIGSQIVASGALDPDPERLDPGSYCLSAETASDTAMGNDGESHDMSIRADVTITYTIVPAPEPGASALLAAALATLVGLGGRRR